MALERALRFAKPEDWLEIVNRHMSPATDQEPAVAIQLVEEQSAPTSSLSQVTEAELKWSLTKGGVTAQRDKLASFHGVQSGHHYLDDAGDMTVLLSIGEGHSA
jgi:hypothetical protein